MSKKAKLTKKLAMFLALVLCLGDMFPVTVKAETETRNVMEGLEPKTNAGEIINPLAATDGNKSGSNEDGNNTKIVAGEERPDTGKEQPARFLRPDWKEFPTQPPVCSRDDGFSARLDGITFSQ